MKKMIMMIMTLCLFFSGRFKKGKKLPDPDAKIGYCAAKKKAFVGYRVSIISTDKEMAILDYALTPANRHDSKIFPSLLFSMEKQKTLRLTDTFYGDSAYYTSENCAYLKYFEKECLFHTKEESGKNRASPRSAKKKSRIRSKVECVFGILTTNFNFGRSSVRTLENVGIECSLCFSSFNFFILMSFFMDQWDDHLSLRQILYKT